MGTRVPQSSCPGGSVFCGPGIHQGAALTKSRIDKAIHTGSDLKKLMISWTRFLYPIAALLAVIGLVYAGFLYITAFGDDSSAENAKKIVTWVVMGIILLLGSFAIVNSLINGLF